MKKLIFFFTILTSLSGCKTEYENLPAYSETKQLQAVIEIPSGSAHYFQYDPATQTFPVAKQAGQDRIIQFLPFPFNFGFIPSTKMDKKRGGNGQAIDIIILGESRETGAVVEVMPLGELILEDAGEMDYKILAIPAKPSERLISATNFRDFADHYPAIKKIIELWYINYNPAGKTRIMGWKDEAFAEAQVQKWLK